MISVAQTAWHAFTGFLTLAANQPIGDLLLWWAIWVLAVMTITLVVSFIFVRIAQFTMKSVTKYILRGGDRLLFAVQDCIYQFETTIVRGDETKSTEEIVAKAAETIKTAKDGKKKQLMLPRTYHRELGRAYFDMHSRAWGDYLLFMGVWVALMMLGGGKGSPSSFGAVTMWVLAILGAIVTLAPVFIGGRLFQRTAVTAITLSQYFLFLRDGYSAVLEKRHNFTEGVQVKHTDDKWCGDIEFRPEARTDEALYHVEVDDRD